MVMPVKDMTGLTFGYLTVLRRHGLSNRPRSKQATWLCRCICGEEVVRIGANLRSTLRGPKKSCGCRHGEMIVDATGSHGMTNHPAFSTWTAMRSRCSNPNDKDWRNYGARGIRVCARWRESFENFWADMGATWQRGLTLDRKRNDRGYSPANCRWATAEQQSNNRRGNIFITTPSGRMSIAQAARAFGVKPITLRKRLERGWTVAKALIPPECST